MKKNILIIPSWYPTKDNEISGSFFKEQANLFCNKYAVRVLYATIKKYSLIKYPFYWLKNLFKKQTNTIETYENPIGKRFVVNQIFIYNFIKKCIPIYKKIEQYNVKIIVKEYQKQIDKLNTENWKPDLIHSHSVFDGGVYAYFLSIKNKIPYIITEHQPFILSNFSTYKQGLYIKATENTDISIAVSNHQKRTILQHGVSCNIIVTGNYIDENRFYLNERKGSIFKLLTVMYADSIKDYKTLFKGINYITKKGYNNFEITIIGGNYNLLSENDPNNPFLIEVKKYNLEKYVKLINFVPRNEMPKYYSNCDVFISTSVAETFGVSMCEALISGKPVISSKNGGSDDFLNNKNSIIFNIGDYEALGKAIIMVMENNNNYDSVSIRNEIIEKFGTDAFISKINTIYKSVL